MDMGSGLAYTLQRHYVGFVGENHAFLEL